LFDFVILDECHRAFSEKRKFLQDRTENIMKLTATMHKDEDEDNVCYKYSIRKAIDNGYLCDYKILCKVFEYKRDDEDEDRFKKMTEWLS
jgi:type I site-specific restriction endonuclease